MTQRFNFASALFMAALVLTSTAVTAETGEALYNEHCATCHAATLRGSAHGAALTGPAFSVKWADRPASALLEYQMREMPPGSSQSLSAGQHAAIAEHVLQQAALPEEATLRLTASDLQSASDETPDAVEFSGAGSVMDLARNAGAYSMRSIEDFRTVTTEELNNPPRGDWLNWRRTLDGHSHSPL
ncbi:MAG: cytochrome c, partial [Pseudomonadota bacterium]|nr:cytochrome c [Pseudomonadota bacterium]